MSVRAGHRFPAPCGVGASDSLVLNYMLSVGRPCSAWDLLMELGWSNGVGTWFYLPTLRRLAASGHLVAERLYVDEFPKMLDDGTHACQNQARKYSVSV